METRISVTLKPTLTREFLYSINHKDKRKNSKQTMISKKNMGYLVASVLVVYALKYKIPLPCFGCQKEGFWYRCVMDTGEGTASCDAHIAAKERVETAANIMDSAGVFVDNLWDFTKTELPGVIADFIATLKEKILGLKDKMAEKIGDVIAFIREKIALFVSKIKDAVVGTYEAFLNNVINPIVSFFIANILGPVTIVFNLIVDFRNLVWGTLSGALESFANIPITSFVGEVVDVFKSIPDAMEFMKGAIFDLINTLKNTMIGVVNTGIRESINGIELSVNTMSDGIDAGVNGVISGLNTVKDGLVSTLNSSINGMAFGVETAVNGVTAGIETAVNTSVNAATGVINSSMNTVETGVNGMIDTTNSVIKGAETAVNVITEGINTTMNGVEDGVNTISKRITDGINLAITPVNKVIAATQDMRNVKLTIETWPLDVHWYPLSFVPEIDEVEKLSAYEVEIDDISELEFDQIDKRLEIEDVTFDDIVIEDLNIEDVNIEAPEDIEDIDIPDLVIDIGDELGNVIPVPDDLVAEDFNFPDIPGFGFVSDKIQEIKAGIKDIFEKAMAPVYDAVATMIALVGAIISATKEFYFEYLTFTAIKARLAVLAGLVKDKIVAVKNWFVDEIVPALINLILALKDPILDFVQTMAQKAWSFLKDIGSAVGSIFNEAYKTVVKVTGIVAKGVFHTGLYVVGSTVEKYTAIIPLPISVKMLLLVTTIFWMFFGGFVRNAKSIVNLAFGSVKGAAVALTDLDRVIDSMFGISSGVATKASFLASSLLV